MYKWVTRQDGVVEVDGKVIELLTGFETDGLKRDVFRWMPFIEKHAKDKGLPVHWVAGFIYAESLGQQYIVSPDGGKGLMQLTHPGAFKGHSPQSTLDNPELNISLGTSVMASIRRDVGFDLPKIASGYNAGLSAKTRTPYPSTSSPWGLRETPGHIARAVRASNTSARLLSMETETPNNRLADAAVKILSRGEMGNLVRGDEFEAFVGAAFGNGKELRKVYSSCAYVLAACAYAAGLAGKRPWPKARAITTWLGVRGFVAPAWIPAGSGLVLRRGDLPYWCGGTADNWYAATDGHVGGLNAGSGHMWQTFEGGGGADGTVFRLSSDMKDIRFSHGRPLRGIWRPDIMYKDVGEPHVPDTEPGMPAVEPTLRLNSPHHEEVKVLQKILGVKEDGFFGPITEAALEAKQKELGLVVDGVYGPESRAALNDTEPGMPAVHPTLQEGFYEPAVGIVQRVVGALVDNKFGPKTKAAVIAFQRAHGLKGDGIVGPKTWPVIDAQTQK